MIAYSRTGTPAPWNNRTIDECGHALPVHSQITMDDVQAIAAAAVAGYGIAWVPCWLLNQHVQRGELVQILPQHRARSLEIHALWPKTQHLRLKVRVAIDALVQRVPALLGAEELPA